jgi:exopolysaccharide biosynthesis polyprenyl glycosylphosphotransferase
LTETLERRLVLLYCLLTDALILWVALNIATLSRLHTLVYLDALRWLHRDQLVCVAVYVTGIALAGGYNPSRITDRFDSVYFAGTGLAASAALLFGASRLMPEGRLSISGRELLLGPWLGLIAFVLWRYALGTLTSRFKSLHRFFYVLGPEAQARRIVEEINSKPNMRANARYATLEELRAKRDEARESGAPLPFENRNAIVVSPEGDRENSAALIEFCESHFGRTFLYPTLHDLLLFRQSKLLAVAGVPLIEVSNRQVFAPYLFTKRAFDIFCAAAGLLIATPLCLVTILAIKLTSPGAVFYTQERMGQKGRRFKLYKFRSMVANAEAKTGPMWAKANDARVTGVGRVIRKHRIDEIPQLYNVLRGDMSLIGPRPERPHFHAEFCAKWPLFERRLGVRPGVTSLSHVLGSYDSDPGDRLRYDLLYISSLSFVTDLKIMLSTIRVVLGAKGAQ